MRPLLLLPLLLYACDEGTPDRDRAGPTDAGTSPDMATDSAPIDAAPPDAVADAGVDGAVPDGLPPPPEVCNGADDDTDGVIDEGVANLCGGCGGIPPEGCQAWIVSAIQDPDDLLQPDQVVGFAGGALGFSEREIEGATCTFFRVPAQHPDAHLGLVNVDSPRANLNLQPIFRPDRGTHAYQNSPQLGALQLHAEGEEVQVRAGGGLAVGPFQLSATAPAPLVGWDTQQLEQAIDLARGDREEGLQLEWEPSAGAAEMRFFIGGSKPVFNLARRRYEVREHYEITARLEDDGDFQIPADLLGGGVPDSSVRVFAERRVVKRLPQGPHAIELRVGQRITVTRNGLLENDAPPGFRIVEPSAIDRSITPGEALSVAWEWPRPADCEGDCDPALPVGEGPLTVNLLLRDSEELQLTLVECTVDDPATGRIELPADFTELWPDADGDTRLLSLQWGVHSRALPAPDQGRLTRSLSAQMWLVP